MELKKILSKMEADGWEISDDFKAAHGHFLQYFLETVEEAFRQPPVNGTFCEKCNPNGVVDGNVIRCEKCGRGLALVE